MIAENARICEIGHLWDLHVLVDVDGVHGANWRSGNFEQISLPTVQFHVQAHMVSQLHFSYRK
jgi:hypothetical protein